MGQYDNRANLKMIKEKTGQKAIYLGFSQGTTQMFYALAKYEDELADLMLKFVALAPCITPAPILPEIMAEQTYYKFPSLGVHHLYGPGYWEDEFLTISGLGEMAKRAGNCKECAPTSIQNSIHWNQVQHNKRFQEYVPVAQYVAGEREGKLIDISSINKIPISMVVGEVDEFCTPVDARAAADLIGA